MTESVCQFCGATKLKSIPTSTGVRVLFACYTVFKNGELIDYRNRSCYRGQIANLTDENQELRRAVGEAGELIFWLTGPTIAKILRDKAQLWHSKWGKK